MTDLQGAAGAANYITMAGGKKVKGGGGGSVEGGGGYGPAVAS